MCVLWTDWCWVATQHSYRNNAGARDAYASTNTRCLSSHSSHPSKLAVNAVVASVPHPAPDAVLRSVHAEMGTEIDAVSAAAATAHGEHVGTGGGCGGSARYETERGGENARGGHVVRGRGARARGLGRQLWE
jgi:hypothetical protein